MKKYIIPLVALFLVIVILAAVLNKPSADLEVTTAEETTAEETTQEVSQNVITLGYYEEKTFNPYKTDSPVNRFVSTLVYDSLYVLDESYMPQPVIAKSGERSENRLTVYINEGLVFSSGAPVTASDVVYSFDLAKASEHYSARLENFLSAVPGTDCVVFTMSTDNIFSQSCLTFPIVQAGTGENDVPTGSGRYCIQQNNRGRFLAENKNSTRNEDMVTEKIILSPISSDAGELYQLQSDSLSFYFDSLDSGEYTKINANTVVVPMNNLVFLAFNDNSAVMSDKAVRNAVAFATDKMTIGENAYNGMYTVAKTPFNPYWYALNESAAAENDFSILKATSTLEDAGYVFAYSNNDYRSRNFEYLEAKMIVNEENEARVAAAQMIHDSLESIGIDVRLSVLEYEDYKKALSEGDYDMYLGEVKLSANMDLSCFFKEEGTLSYGIDSASTVASAYSDFALGKIDITTFNQVFDEEKPFVPICYRSAVAYYSRAISFEGSITEYEPFLNAYSWEIASEK